MSCPAKWPIVAHQCRVCMFSLADGNVHDWRNIFTDSDEDLGGLLKFIIEEVTGQLVKPNENLPESMCPSCLAAVKTAFIFKRRFERSIQLLEQSETTSSFEDWTQFCEVGLVEEFQSLKGNCSEGNQNTELGTSTQEKGLNSESERPFKCSHCLKSFSLKTTLDRHIRIHTGERPFECPHCLKNFNQKGTLNLHLRLHTDVRPFECSHCSKTFIRQSSLNAHLLTHTGERPFNCTQCSKSFTQNRSLQAHLRTHTGERPFKCSLCLKSFNQKNNLDTHIRTHTGERPYKCTQCSKAFTQPGQLKDHFRIHTGEQPFKCSHCTRTFTHKSSLRHHLKTHI